MHPAEGFLHCPRCGVSGSATETRLFDCTACGFRFHFNVGVAVAGLLLDANGKALFIRRARDPGKGKLALPGGFVDPNERVEDALRREIIEEVGLDVGPLTFLSSQPNLYAYRGFVYPLCDLFFSAPVLGTAPTLAPSEVSEIVWLDPDEVELDTLAFPSMRAALTHYRGAH